MAPRLLKIGFIGAGGVNFGGPEGPWDHASRLERYSTDNASRVEVVVSAVVEPDKARAEAVLTARRASPQYSFMYTNTQIFSSVAEMLDESHMNARPDAVFVGLPPFCHGSMASPFDVEVQLARAGIHMLVEKPISCHHVGEVQQVNDILNSALTKDGKKLVVSVGYMLRYSSVVKKMQEIIAQQGGRVLSTVARYNCTYNSIGKASWWNRRLSGGPIVEQATHFCDLSRLFGGEVEIDSVQAVCVGAHEKIAKLSKMPVDESTIHEADRIPRTTSAVWKYKNGAVGSLNHALLLQGHRYTSEFEVWGDGVRLVLVDPYGRPKLLVRTADSDEDQVVHFQDTDMYYDELREFMDAIMTGNPSGICSSYTDAFNTYSLSWAITDAASVQRNPLASAQPTHALRQES